MRMIDHDVRPWGEYFVLEDTPSHKVKRIVVKPQSRLSYQYHMHRSEIWTIVEGDAKVVLDDKHIILTVGQYIYIPQGAKHRIENVTAQNLVFIEVQVGSYFGEDDIVRIEDDYNRK